MPEVSADGRVFTVRIRPGIFFADDPAFGGRPRELVAQDYVYAIKRFYDPRWNSSDLYLYESLKLPGLTELRDASAATRQPFDYDRPVEGLRALDRYTLRITLGEPDPRFVYQLADPVLHGRGGARGGAALRRRHRRAPRGHRAFRLKSWRRALAHRAGALARLARPALRRHAGRRPRSAQASRRTWRAARCRWWTRWWLDVIEEAQPRWLSFLDGSLDWLEVPGPFRRLAAPGDASPRTWRASGIQLQRQLRPDMAMSFFFMDHPLVGGYTPDKVALRRAIGAGASTTTPTSSTCWVALAMPAQSTVPPFTSGYDPAYRSEMSEYSPARAKALLDLHGYVDRDGDGWREQPDGRPLVLRMAGTSTLQDRRKDEVWKRCMDAVGLRMSFDARPGPNC
jgi:hypothetical protein